MLRTLISGVFASLLLALAPSAQGATVYTIDSSAFTGEAYTVTSFTFDEGTGVGTLIKDFDASSIPIVTAVALGTLIDWMTTTQFDDHPGNPTQVAVFTFANVLLTGYAANTDETITFEGTLTPEPSAISLLLLGAGGIAIRLRRRQRDRAEFRSRG